MKAEVRAGFEYRRAVERIIYDPQVFPICMPKREEVKRYLFKKEVYFVHRYSNRWVILRLVPEIKRWNIPDKNDYKNHLLINREEGGVEE